MAETKKISPKARKKAFRNWSYGNLTCFSQAHMQNFGYLVAMLPIVDDLYEKDEEKIEALSTYTTFFNTEPQIGTMVIGLTTGLEEARANGEHIDAETINGIRAGLMGPLAPSSLVPLSPSCWVSPLGSRVEAPYSAPSSTSWHGTSSCTLA